MTASGFYCYYLERCSKTNHIQCNKMETFLDSSPLSQCNKLHLTFLKVLWSVYWLTPTNYIIIDGCLMSILTSPLVNNPSSLHLHTDPAVRNEYFFQAKSTYSRWCNICLLPKTFHMRREPTTFWSLWWCVWLTIRAQTTLSNSRLVILR